MSVGRASGRLDLLGGVADYAGALVLEQPTLAETTVTAVPAAAFEVGDVRLRPDELAALAALDDAGVRREIAGFDRSTHYPIGVVVLLVRAGIIEAPAVRLEIESTVPIAMGVSSSAALEVATARALGADDRLDALALATLCQAAENHIVGAPCGIMDQVAVAVGHPGAVLPILCRPASVDESIPLPQGVELVGWPSGAAHDVAGDPYGQARCASFMGRRIAEDALGAPVPWTAEIPERIVDTLPERLIGAEFLDRWGDHGDPLSTVDPAVAYPVRAAACFGGAEHRRSQTAVAALRRGDTAALAPLLAASHAGYTAMGLGHPATDAVVEQAIARPGVHAARVSGGGCGGTVVVVCDRGALDDVDGLIR